MLTQAEPDGTGSHSVRFWRMVVLFLVFIILMQTSFAASVKTVIDDKPIYELEELSGRKIGILVGTILDRALEKKLDYTYFDYYDDYNVMEGDLLDGVIDGIVGDYPVLLQIAAYVPGLRVLRERVEDGYYGLAFRKSDASLRGWADKIVAELRESGELELLTHKWLTGPEQNKTVQMPRAANGATRLRVGTSSVMPPFSYRGGDDQVIGFDLELAAIIAKKTGRELVIVDMEFGSLIPSLIGNEIDMIASCLSITEERQKIIDFSEGYFLSGVGVLVRE